MDAAHANGSGRELDLQRLGKTPDGELGGVVGRLQRHGHEPEQARDIDDVPFISLDQVRQKRLGAVNNAPEVDIHDPFEVFAGELLHTLDQRHPGIVYDEMNGTMLAKHGLREGIDCRAVCDVDDVRAACHTCRDCERLRFLEPVRINVRQCEVAAAPGQLDGKRAPDPGPGTGYCGDFPWPYLHASLGLAGRTC